MRLLLPTSIVLSAAIFTPAPVNAQPVCFTKNLMSHTELVRAEDMARVGTTVYLTDQQFGLKIIDASDPHNPAIVGTHEINGLVANLAAGHDRVYMRASIIGPGSRLVVLDVSDPTNPVETAQLLLPIADGRIKDNLLYATRTNGFDRFEIYSLDDPDAPTLVGSYVHPGYFKAYEFDFVGDTAFVAASEGGDTGLFAFDVSNPASPTLIGSLTIPNGRANRLAIAGSVAYLADSSNGLIAISIADPAAMSVLSMSPTPSTAYDVAAVADMVYLADELNGILAYDVADPANPLALGTYPTLTYTRHVLADSLSVFSAGFSYYLEDWMDDPEVPTRSGLAINDVSTPPSGSPVLAEIPLLDPSTSNRAESVAAIGTTLYFGSNFDSLRVFDVADPTNPIEHPTFSGAPQHLTVRDGRLFGAGGTVSNKRLWRYDTSNPLDPTLEQQYELANTYTTNFDVKGDLAFTRAISPPGVEIIDLTARENLNKDGRESLLATLSLPGDTVSDIAATDSVIYVAQRGAGVHIVSVADPAAPAVLSTFSVPGALGYSVEIAADFLYLGNDADGLRVFDLTTPDSPTQLAHHPNIPGLSLIVGDRSYQYGNGGIRSFDLNDPINPAEIGTVLAPGGAFAGLAATADAAFTAESGFGVRAIDPMPTCAPACPADTTNDGILDNGDIGAFVTLFLAADLAADFNSDGILDNGDIGAFVQAFLAGCD